MTRRTTLTLTEREERTLATLSDRKGAEWVLFESLAAHLGYSLTPDASEATVIRVLMSIGAQVLIDQALEDGYEQLAEIWPEIHDEAEAEERRRRYADEVDRVMPG
ncbi:hypothetical protein F3087_36115 [Nocardia colli]|uniref:Uncharacterized protein n=1 Tax=Nocardia colli TaxID=2545717 RepID=A0A5N0E6M2_9NOCA|nr:hypothetical protein [Nocardia colli]KAA8884079.1 hypothetical protein F3087_36115 [Nocardia colli]